MNDSGFFFVKVINEEQQIKVIHFVPLNHLHPLKTGQKSELPETTT